MMLSTRAAAVFNAAARVLSIIAPNQYKFSQAGWDQPGWTESAAAVAQGRLKRPFARFTILGVGNNPGIYIIATGAVMMSVGIPWAFYVKPWLVRRKKKQIQDQLARGEYVAKSPRAARNAGRHAGGVPSSPTSNGDTHAPISASANASSVESELEK